MATFVTSGAVAGQVLKVLRQPTHVRRSFATSAGRKSLLDARGRNPGRQRRRRRRRRVALSAVFDANAAVPGDAVRLDRGSVVAAHYCAAVCWRLARL